MPESLNRPLTPIQADQVIAADSPVFVVWRSGKTVHFCDPAGVAIELAKVRMADRICLPAFWARVEAKGRGDQTR
jgi:hypothetical protein